MKTLSDYKGDDALELWADLLEPLTVVFQDDEILTSISKGKPVFQVASLLLRKHKKDASDIILAIDPTEITAMNLLPRVMKTLGEIKSSEEFKDFFGSSQPETKDSASSGSAMENTGADGQ